MLIMKFFAIMNHKTVMFDVFVATMVLKVLVSIQYIPCLFYSIFLILG